MMFTMTKTRKLFSNPAAKVASLILAFGVVGLAPQAMADHGWAQPASDGTVDESSKDIYMTTGVTMSILKSARSKSTVRVRYAVPNIEGLSSTWGSNHSWRVRFKDEGTQSRVILKLKSYNWLTGVTTTLWTFDSDDYPASNDYQNKTISDTTGAWQFSPSLHAYYIEVSIKRKSRDAKPGLAGFYMANFI